jgi:hypothetical protein
MASASGTKQASDRVSGGPFLSGPVIAASVARPNGALLWNSSDISSVGQNLEWPSPLAAAAYAIKDFPRFYAPEWGPTPIPAGAKVDPALVATNGYDFQKNVNGDTYVFLLGDSIEEWHGARAEFVALAGPTPALPDFAFGTWFTYWHQYTEAEAKGEVLNWTALELPIDVWALDMNWRESPHGHSPGFQPGQEHFYDFPNTALFPDFADPGTGWFEWLKAQKLRTYFNDHPFPTDGGKAMQTSKDEVAFRWAGLTKWLQRGLTYWWFDANWKFSIPPPTVAYGGSGDGADWDGMSNRVWGSHLYFTTVEIFNKLNPTRAHTMPLDRPMALTKYADANMHPGLVQHQHPAQHRYPVWWTGDGVSLEASIQSMVDSGVSDFKPYVHSDCGGDYRGSAGDLLRWTAHCAFGSIHRFHGADHRPWSYDAHTTSVIKSYLATRYSMLPSIIAAGHSATFSGFPLVARCDILYPMHAAEGAASNMQYFFLNDTLVAPIWMSKDNATTVQAWIPPGSWKVSPRSNAEVEDHAGTSATPAVSSTTPRLRQLCAQPRRSPRLAPSRLVPPPSPARARRMRGAARWSRDRSVRSTRRSPTSAFRCGTAMGGSSSLLTRRRCASSSRTGLRSRSRRTLMASHAARRRRRRRRRRACSTSAATSRRRRRRRPR